MANGSKYGVEQKAFWKNLNILLAKKMLSIPHLQIKRADLVPMEFSNAKAYPLIKTGNLSEIINQVKKYISYHQCSGKVIPCSI
jgi:hypothetical protein